MRTLLVSDIHLTPARPDIAGIFSRFLAERVPGADALYILGDLFEYWAGDDDPDTFNAAIKVDIARCAKGGVQVFFMHGNRDFLAGERFANDARLTLLPDPTLIELCGRRTLLSHGDELCTDDAAYQDFRRHVRTREWQRDFLARPLPERRREIEELRERSETEKRIKPAAIMDVNPLAVEALLRQNAYPDLIHGHTHRPARHEHVIDGRPCMRWVLADWYREGSYLVADSEGVRSERIA